MGKTKADQISQKIWNIVGKLLTNENAQNQRMFDIQKVNEVTFK